MSEYAQCDNEKRLSQGEPSASVSGRGSTCAADSTVQRLYMTTNDSTDRTNNAHAQKQTSTMHRRSTGEAGADGNADPVLTAIGSSGAVDRADTTLKTSTSSSWTAGST